VSTFEGTALDPVPFARKVVLPLVAASIAFIHVFLMGAAPSHPAFFTAGAG
jgi:hypothetical protein